MNSKMRMIVLIALLMGACSLPARSRPGFSVDLTVPSNGAIFPLSFRSSLRVYAKAAADAGGILNITYYASGIVIGTDSSPAAATGDSNIEWVPPGPGEYFLQAEAQRAHDSALSAAVRVCVIEGINVAASGYTGPCPLPAPDASAPAGSPVSLTATATPASLAYPWDDCPALADPTISFEVHLNDLSDRVALVTVTSSVTQGSLGSGSYSDVIALNWTSSLPSGEKIFTGAESALTNMFRGALGGDIGSVEWTVEAFSRTNEILVEDPHSIPAAPCDLPVIGVPMPIVIAPTETLTPTATSTATLIPYVPPTKKPKDNGGGGDNGGGSTPVSCGSYSDESSCSKAGCKWDPGKSVCN